MSEHQMEFERKQLPHFRKLFRESIEDADNENFKSIFKKLIASGGYAEIVEKIKILYDFTSSSMFLEKMKLNWWHEYLTINMQKTAPHTIKVTDFEGLQLTFHSIEQVYKEFIKPKNEKIWKPYENIFTKILTEWVIETLINATKHLPIKSKIDFIKKTTSIIDKHQAFEEYSKYQLNQQLEYFKKILELSLTDLNINEFVHEDSSAFKPIFENDMINRLRKSLFEEKFDDFFLLVRTIYAAVPYQLYSNTESAFHSIFHVIAHLISSTARSEEATNVGRIDTVIENPPTVFLFELKINDATKAIQQIKAKKYYEKYLLPNNTIFFIGVSFSIKKRNINNWKVEKFT